MFVNKSQYSLKEISSYWSNLTYKDVSEDDLMNLAGIDTALYLTADIVNDVPKPKLIICAYYTGTNAIVIKVNGQPASERDQYFGRIFLWPNQILKILNEGIVSLKQFTLNDEDKLIELSQSIEINKSNLVITHEEKLRFEKEYIYPKLKINLNLNKLAECLNPNHPFYAEELAIALETWIHLSENHTPFKKSIKTQAIEFIKEKYPQWKNSENPPERIATVVNWSKKDGAPKSS